MQDEGSQGFNIETFKVTVIHRKKKKTTWGVRACLQGEHFEYLGVL